jgi:O-antigen ligase
MAIAMALPWLNPFAFGPSPALVPWLVTLAICACLLFFSVLFSASAPAQASFAQRWAYPAAMAWLIAGLLSSGIGIVQYFGAAAAFDPWINQAGLGEAFANLRQRNQFASLTNIALAALIWLAAGRASQAPLTLEFPQRDHWFRGLAAGLLAAGNAASASRTGLLQLVLVLGLCGVWGLWRQTAVRQVLLAAVLAYLLATLLLPWLAGFDLSLHGMVARLRSGDQACASRLTLWRNVLHLIAQKPWLGWGWGELDYAHYVTLYDGPRFCEILDNAHNLPLHLAVELGVPVALLVCAAFVCWLLRQRPWKECDPNRQLAWSVLAMILLHSMLEYPLWYGPFQLAVGLCIGMLWRGTPAFAWLQYEKNTHLKAAVRALTASTLIAFVVCAGWDYHRVSQIYLAPESRDMAYREDTLAKIQRSWLFGNQLRFAELLLTPLSQDNARWAFDTASALLHYSPEPRVIEKVIESALMLGLDDEAAAHLVRYRAAFAQEYARWALTNAQLVSDLDRRR